MKPENNNKETFYIRDGRSPLPVKEVTSRIMSANKGKNTKPEIVLRKALFKEGLRGYRINRVTLPGSPDIIYTRKKIAIFVNGCFWHRCPYCYPPIPKTHVDFWSNKFTKNIERDKRKIYELKSMGYIVLVFWECEIKENIQNCVNQVKYLLLFST